MLRHTFRSPLRAAYEKKIAILEEKFTEITRFGEKNTYLDVNGIRKPVPVIFAGLQNICYIANWL